VIKLETAGMRVYEGEGGAGDVFLCNAESRANSFDEESFAGAQRPAE
jgi:hypothetical protein